MFAGTTKLSQTSILRKSPAKAGLLVSMWSTCGRDLKQILLFHYVVNFKKAPEGALVISEHFLIRSHRYLRIHARRNVRVCVSPGLRRFQRFKQQALDQRSANDLHPVAIVSVPGEQGGQTGVSQVNQRHLQSKSRKAR